MKIEEALRELEAAGTAQNRKIYARHGVKATMYGVSFAALGKLAKAIKVDHELAVALWETGNHDGRILATMVADPGALTSKQLDAWAKELDNYVVTDAFSKMVMKSPHCRAKADAWTKRKGEWVSTAGWTQLAQLAESPALLDDAAALEFLGRIEAGIHQAPNRTRFAMNLGVIALGLRPTLTEAAIAAAKRIGTVDVDHGETNCQTPEAVSYIRKTLEHRRAKASKRGKKVSKKVGKKVSKKAKKKAARK